MTKKLSDSFIAAICIGLILVMAPAIGASPLPHGKDCLTAEHIRFGGNIGILLTSTEDRAVFRITLEQRGLLDVWMDAGSLDAWKVELLDSSCQIMPIVNSGDSVVRGKYSSVTIPSKDIADPARNVWTLAPGDYFVRFVPNPISVFQEEFTFHTKFTPHYGHDCETAHRIAMPASVDGDMLYADDREVFRVDTTTWSAIHAWTTAPLESFDPGVSLRLSDCSVGVEQLVENPDTPGITTTPLPPGTYYLVLQPQRPNWLGPYTVHVNLAPVSSDDEEVHR